MKLSYILLLLMALLMEKLQFGMIMEIKTGKVSLGIMNKREYGTIFIPMVKQILFLIMELD